MKTIVLLLAIVVAATSQKFIRKESRTDHIHFKFGFFYYEWPIQCTYEVWLDQAIDGLIAGPSTAYIHDNKLEVTETGNAFHDDYEFYFKVTFLMPPSNQQRTTKLFFPRNTFPVGKDTQVIFHHNLFFLTDYTFPEDRISVTHFEYIPPNGTKAHQ